VKLSNFIHRHLSVTRTQCPPILAPLRHQWHHTYNHLRCRLLIRSVSSNALFLFIYLLSTEILMLKLIFCMSERLFGFGTMLRFPTFPDGIHASGHRRLQISASGFLSPYHRNIFFYYCHSHDGRLVPLGFRSSTLIQFLFSAYP
jgi:hypothetical protein